MTNIKQETASGFIWMTIGKVGSGITVFLVSIILARLLVPDDFALVALLTIFILISQSLVDSGFSQAFIRANKVTNLDLSSLFYFNLVFSILIYIILFICSPYIALFFHAPKLLTLSRVAFLVIPFNALLLVPSIILSRRLKFNKISQSNIFSMFLAGAISIISAFLGIGVWAIVINLVLQSVFNAIFLIIYCNWLPEYLFSWRSLKKYLSFGFYVLLQKLYDVIITNFNTFVIGKYYTKLELGCYSQGGSLLGYFIYPLIKVIQNVTYPITSKVRNDYHRFRMVYISFYQLMFLIFIPISIFLIIYANEIILFLYGEKWEAAGTFLRIASFSGLFYPIQVLSENVIMVEGKSKTLLALSIFRQTLRLIAIFAVINKGVFILACVYTSSGIIGGSFITIYSLILLKYNIFSFFYHVFRVALPVLIASIVVFYIGTISSLLFFQLAFDFIIYGTIILTLSLLMKNPTVSLIKSIFIKK